MVAIRRATSVRVASSRLAITWAAGVGGEVRQHQRDQLWMLVADEAADLLGSIRCRKASGCE